MNEHEDIYVAVQENYTLDGYFDEIQA